LLRNRSRIRVAAVAAGAADLDHRAFGGETGAGGSLADAPRNLVVIDMHRLPATVADQEDAVVEAVGMLVGDIGVRTFDPPREIGSDEQIEDPIDAVGGDPSALRVRNSFGERL